LEAPRDGSPTNRFSDGVRPVEVQTRRALGGGEASGIGLELIPGAYPCVRREKPSAGDVIFLAGDVVVSQTPARE